MRVLWLEQPPSTRVPDVRVAIGLLGGGVVVVELTTEEVQPVLEEENAVVQVV
jgi:hypothetical protein